MSQSNPKSNQEILEVMKAMAEGKPTVGKKLKLNPKTKQLEVIGPFEKDPDELTTIDPSDATMFLYICQSK